MPNSTPTPRSASQIIGDMLTTFLSRQGISNIRIGSGILSIFEAAGQSDMRSSADTFNLLNATDLSQATGITLDNKGADENIPRFNLSPGTGNVTIGDSSFTKISTTLAPNQPAPIVGTTILNVADASLFPPTGNIYIGRGTNDYEGPIHYTATTNLGVNWSLTLSVATTKFHNTSETVILAQGGNRLVGAGTIVNTPQASLATAVSYSILYPQTLPDGENILPNVLVVAQSPGTIGNCIAGAITNFTSPPFTNATVTNPLPVTTGTDTELDDDYRERIQNVRASRALGTVLAITTNSIGVTDGISRVSSASFVRRFQKASTLYIDDGSGYEMTTAGIPIESIIDSAIGGEDHFETTHRPIAQAFAQSTNVAPFTLRTTDQLAVKVGGIPYIHSFAESQFHSISNASAYEVVASINGNSTIGFAARTVNAGANVILFANRDTDDDIEVIQLPDINGATDANNGLGFTLGTNYTLQLFKNDRLLSKDGRSAIFNSNPFSGWIPITGSQTLTVEVDNTPPVTYTFDDQDFINANTGFVTLNKNSGPAWAAVFNAKIPGITATFANGILTLTSNAGAVAKAAIAILDSTLVGANFFTSGLVNGSPNDYTLDRNNAEIFLNQPLQPNDKLSIGTSSTRAFLQSGLIGTTTLATNANLWFAVDGKASIVKNGVSSTVPYTIAVTSLHPWGHTLTITASSGTPFVNILPGDWIILWDSSLDISLQGIFKVVNASNTTVIIERREGCGLRVGHRSVALLTSGATVCSVLTTGGSSNTVTTPLVDSINYITNSVEVYNPNTKLSAPVKGMAVPRAYHTATTLANGKVLVSGGVSEGGTALNSLEIYDPTGDSWTLSGSTLATGVYHHTATLLGNGTVLIAGGLTTGGLGSVNTFYIYNPTSDTITTTSSLIVHRARHRAVLLPNGDVLLVGGYNGATVVATTEIFSHIGITTAASGSMTRARQSFGLALIGTSPTSIIAMGNAYGTTGNSSYEIYSIAGGTWGAETTIPNNLVFENKELITIPNGHVVGLYGYNSGTVTTSIGVTYDGTTFTSITADPLWTDSSAKWQIQTVPIANGSATIKNKVVAIGGVYQNSTAFGFAPTATVEEYDEVGAIWTVPDPAVSAGVTLTQSGLSFARTNENIQEVTIPSGTNYTASSLVTALNNSLVGAFSSVYLTNQLRINTNSYGIGGDISLLAQNAATGLSLINTNYIPNLVNHVGSTESGSELGTPLFADTRVMAEIEGNGLSVTTPAVTSDQSLVGLLSWRGGIDNTTTYHPSAYTYLRAGSNYNFNSRLSASSNFTSSSDVFTRTTPNVPFIPGDRAYFAAPFAIGPNDVLNVIVDNDIAKQFAINMFRQIGTINNTYGQTNVFRDESAGNLSLAVTFGLNFNFNDFTAYMPARGLAFNGDSTREMLFRYYRPGADGNGVQVRFGNPSGPNLPLSTNTVLTNSDFKTDVTVQLKSGALRTPTTDNSTKLGQVITSLSGTGTVLQILNLAISSATRAGGTTVTLTLTLPGSVTDHGLAVGNLIWVNSTSVDFPSGLKTITSRTSTTVVYTETGSNVTTANIGDVSFDSLGGATFTGSGTVVSDWFRFVDPLNSPLGNHTFYISAVDGNGRSVTTKLGDQFDPTSLTPGTTILWYPISIASNLQTFANPAETSAAIVTEINALAGQGHSTCPITATLLSDGTGIISQSTPDFLGAYPNSWYTLTDGVNWIQTTTPPGSVAGDYSLTFKNPVTGSLSSGADWQHEIIYLAPSTAQNVVDWLNAPTVTGLSTVASIQTSNRAQSVQIATLTVGSAGGIQVQGGMANGATATIVGNSTKLLYPRSVSTVINSDAIGLSAGMWCEIDNTLPRPVFPWGLGFGITSWTADGLVQFNNNVTNPIFTAKQAKLQFERQGKFIAISDMGMNGLNIFYDGTSNAVLAGNWIRISTPVSPTIGQVSSGNEGIFRVLRSDFGKNGSTGTVWIENLNAVEEQSECVIESFFTASAMPGDTFVILDPVFGTQNQGIWTILDVGTTTATSGDSFTNTTSFVVDVSKRAVQAQGVTSVLTSANVNLVYIAEGINAKFVRRILTISPNQANGAYTDIKWDSQTQLAEPGSVFGSIITALDKLNFSLSYFSGVDGYNYGTGLVGAVNQVLYGSPGDSVTYPGIAAGDSRINVSGSVIKRVQLAVSIRVKTSTPLLNIENRVKSAVATFINQSPNGISIAFSDISAAIQKVIGVTSIVITSPLYNITNDLIPVHPQEKARILNLDDDIQVSFLGV